MPATTPATTTTRHSPRAAADFAAPAGGVLDTLESVFWTLCRGPAPLALPGRLFAAGRRRPVRLVEARELLLWPGRIPPETRDTVWAAVVRRAQSNEPAWIVGAAGLLLPGLRRVTDRLAAGYAGDRDDLDAEALTGFLTALATIDPDSGRLPSRLCWAAYRAGLALRHRDTDATRRRSVGMDGAAPPRPWGHPDFVLAAAVNAAVITTAEARLIGATRLEHVSVETAAQRLGISRGAVLSRRNRAEHRLAAAIRTGELTTTHTATSASPQTA
jgi:predicted DNA-binding protein (UPF0251 family)